jgi:hypothetical protein
MWMKFGEPIMSKFSIAAILARSASGRLAT